MSVAPAIPRSVSDPPHRGRLSAEEREERTVVGRLVHLVEHHSFGAAAELSYARIAVSEVPTHDAQADAHVEAVELLGWLLQAGNLSRDDVRLIGRAIVGHARGYHYHDGREDAAVGLTAYRVSTAHVEVKAINGGLELAASGVQRGRPRRGTRAAAEQAPLGLEG